MSIALENTLSVGGIGVMAVAETHIAPARAGPRVGISCSKAPAAIVFGKDSQIVAVDLNGNRLDEAEIEKRFPGAIARLRAND